MTLPPLIPVGEIQRRLREAFPEGADDRGFCIREIAAKTVFVMLYVGAVAGSHRWLRPNQVTRMTDAQAARTSDAERAAWATASLKSSKGEIEGRWYADNTREPIRDETLRLGLIPCGAVVERTGLPTTSARPRYALQPDFVGLFAPGLSGEALSAAFKAWREQHLSTGARARIAIVRRGAVAGSGGVLVLAPNGVGYRMAEGPSASISKAVIEDFAPRFLKQPALIFLSESGKKVIAQHDDLATSIGLTIRPDKVLPDIILADLGEERDALLVFVEVVATDGPVDETRRTALTDMVSAAGYDPRYVAFVTAYADRAAAAFRRTVVSLAWNSFAWFASEPDGLIALLGRTQRPLRDFLQGGTG